MHTAKHTEEKSEGGSEYKKYYEMCRKKGWSPEHARKKALEYAKQGYYGEKEDKEESQIKGKYGEGEPEEEEKEKMGKGAGGKYLKDNMRGYGAGKKCKVCGKTNCIHMSSGTGGGKM